jgi:hypothetical protein
MKYSEIILEKRPIDDCGLRHSSEAKAKPSNGCSGL